MKLGWYINRLRSMEPAEVLHRFGEKARKLVSLRRHQGWQLYPAAEHHPVLPQLRDAVLSASPEQRSAIAEAADAILAGRFSALGREWPPRSADLLFPAELWRLDPGTGGMWPDARTYAFDIDFRHDGTRGDVKYVWEINRLQILPVLATHWLLAGDLPALRAIEAAITSWHDANPPFGGVAWASGIEVAIRAINLIIVLDVAGDNLSEATRQKSGQILAASTFWLARFPSHFSSANNHLVAELAGQYLLGLGGGVQLAPVRQNLLDELDKQILADGTGAEQTPTYAAFTAELVLLCALAARLAADPFPATADQRLAAFADFAAWLGQRGFGDDDEGRVLTLGGEDNYVASVAAAINGQLQRPGPTPPADDFRSLIYARPPHPGQQAAGLKTFAEGGLSLWHGKLAGRTVELCFDHGPLGYLSIAAHGHADALSVTLALDGMPVLVDPGTWLYGSGGAWRDWFRSTPAHNTLNLGGASQSQIGGPFNWSHKAQARLEHTLAEPDWMLEAQHDGYQRRYGVQHRRRLQRVGETIEITDRLVGGERQAELVFQLAPEIEAAIADNVVTLKRNGATVMNLVFPDAEIAVTTGGELPGQGGWVSPHFGLRLPAARVAWRGTVGAAGVTTILRPIQSS